MVLRCKVCGANYDVKNNDLFQVPLWRLENCSKTCRNTYSSEKLLNLSTSTALLKI